MIAQNFGIILIFFGENESEYGAPMEKNRSPKRSKEFFTIKKINKTFISGISYKDLIHKHKFSYHDLMPYLPSQHLLSTAIPLAPSYSTLPVRISNYLHDEATAFLSSTATKEDSASGEA